MENFHQYALIYDTFALSMQREEMMPPYRFDFAISWFFIKLSLIEPTIFIVDFTRHISLPTYIRFSILISLT